MKPGLLLKEAPEPRFELYCDNYGSKTKPCNFLFDTGEEMEKHKLEVHNSIPGVYYGERTGWFNIEYLQREGFERKQFQLPIRPSRRFNVTREMLDNQAGRTPGTKKCWCGKPKELWDSAYFQTYCSDVHRNLWWTLTDYVGPHKNKFLAKNNKCASCGYEGKRSWNTHLEMDHIIALIFGGHPWDERNLQALCFECHKIKTKSDVGILAWWKRESNYDIGAIIPDPQTTLDEIFEYSYVFS